MAQNWWDKYPSAQQPAPQSSLRQIVPPDPAKAQERGLNITKTANDIARQSGQMEGDALSNAGRRYDNQSKPVYDRIGAMDKVRGAYRADKRILKYEEAVPIYASALTSPNTPEADNLLVNAIAKIGDPITGVGQREGESYEQAAPTAEQWRAKLAREFGTDGAGNFTKEGRLRIKEAIRNRMAMIGDQGRLARKEHTDYIKSLGIPDADPDSILGPWAGEPFKRFEADYLKRLEQENPGAGGRAAQQLGVGSQPANEVPGGFEVKFKDQQGGLQQFTREQDGAFQRFVKSKGKGNLRSADLSSFYHTLTGAQLDPKYAAQWADHYNRTGQINTAHAAHPSIKDRIDKRVAEQDDTGRFMEGGGDTLTFGGMDEFRAGSQAFRDSVRGIGSLGDLYNENIQVERGVQRGLDRPGVDAYSAGQVVGGLVLPTFGARSVGQIAKLGAAQGGAYGFGSGEGLTGRLGNAAMGTAAGATVGAAVAKGLPMAGQAIRGLRPQRSPVIPPLVDPATGGLNMPMDAMTQAQRMQEFSDLGINQVSPGMAGGRTGRVVEQGFNNLPGSAGIMEDFNAAASSQLRGAADNVAGTFGASRTFNEGGSELQRGAKQWMDRADSLDAKVYNAIPIPDQAQASVIRTRGALVELTNQFGSNPKLAEALKSAKLEQYSEALMSGKLSWADIKAFRSRIGYEIGEQRLGGDSPTKDQLRALYGALSEDMRNTAGSMGPKAIRAFERANTFHHQMEQRVEEGLTRILGPDIKATPEKAALAVQAMAQGGKSTADLRTLAQVRSSTIKSGAWDEIAATMIRMGGQPANSSGREFNPQTFVNWYADIAEPARNMLFKPELRKGLDRFVAANQQLGRVKGLANASNTAPVMFGGSAILTAAAALTNPLLGAKLAVTLGGNYALGKLWTNPGFVNWATGYTRALASQNPNAVRSQAGRLGRLAAAQPAIREEVSQIARLIANDNFATSAAAEDPNEQ